MNLETTLRLIGLAAVVFIGLALILKRVLSSHMDVAMKRIQQLNEDNLKREMELKRKLDEAEKNYQTRIAEAEKETVKLKELTEHEAHELKDKIITQANEERNEIIKEAREEAQSYRLQVKEEFQRSVAEHAAKLVKSAFSDSIFQGVHNQLVEEALKEIASSNLLKTVPDNVNIEIISPAPFTADQRKRLAEVLTNKIGKGIAINKERVDDALIAGLCIKIGDLIIDGSLRNKMTQNLKIKLPAG